MVHCEVITAVCGLRSLGYELGNVMQFNEKTALKRFDYLTEMLKRAMLKN